MYVRAKTDQQQRTRCFKRRCPPPRWSPRPNHQEERSQCRGLRRKWPPLYYVLSLEEGVALSWTHAFQFLFTLHNTDRARHQAFSLPVSCLPGVPSSRACRVSHDQRDQHRQRQARHHPFPVHQRRLRARKSPSIRNCHPRGIIRHLSCREERGGEAGKKEGRKGTGYFDVDWWGGEAGRLCVCIGLVPDLGKSEARAGRLSFFEPHSQNHLCSSYNTDTGGSAERRGGVGRECGDQGTGGCGGRFPCSVAFKLLGRWQRYAEDEEGREGEERGKEGGAALHFRAFFSYFCIRVLGTERHINLR